MRRVKGVVETRRWVNDVRLDHLYTDLLELLMASFDKAFAHTFENEGGMQTTKVTGDRGGQTCCGIARKYHHDWAGWAYVDRGENPPMFLVKTFYGEKFWSPIRGNEIKSQGIAFALFDFGVNAGSSVAVKLMQSVLGLVVDGKVGPKTLEALNKADREQTLMAFTLAAIARYHVICMKDRTQTKFLLGWVGRALRLLEGAKDE